MAIQTRTYLKSKFETGDKPTQADFIDVFDSYAHLSDQNTLSSSFIIDGNSDTYAVTLQNLASFSASGASLFQIASDSTINLIAGSGGVNFITTGGGTATYNTDELLTGATNGLSSSGPDVSLGGTLASNTTISLSTYLLRADGSNAHMMLRDDQGAQMWRVDGNISRVLGLHKDFVGGWIPGNVAGAIFGEFDSGTGFGGMVFSKEGYVNISHASIAAKHKGLKYYSDYPDIDWATDLAADGLLIPHQKRVAAIISATSIPLTQKAAASGVASLDSSTLVPLAQLPENVVTTYATIALMQADQPNPTEKMLWVTDASADAAITSGWAVYRWKGTTGSGMADYWLLFAEDPVTAAVVDIIVEFATTAALIAGQSSDTQVSGNEKKYLYLVADASGDTTHSISKGYAVYKWNGTTAGTMADYKLISAEQYMEGVQTETPDPTDCRLDSIWMNSATYTQSATVDFDIDTVNEIIVGYSYSILNFVGDNTNAITFADGKNWNIIGMSEGGTLNGSHTIVVTALPGSTYEVVVTAITDTAS